MNLNLRFEIRNLVASIQNYQSKHSKLVGESTVATSDNASKPTMTAAELALQTPIILLEELCPLFQGAGYKGRKLVLSQTTWVPDSHVGGCGRLSCLQDWPYILCLQQVSASPLHGRCLLCTKSHHPVSYQNTSISSNTRTKTNTNDAKFHHYIASACDAAKVIWCHIKILPPKKIHWGDQWSWC